MGCCCRRVIRDGGLFGHDHDGCFCSRPLWPWKMTLERWRKKGKKKKEKKKGLQGRCSRPLNGGGLEHKVSFLLEDIDCVHSIHNSDQFATSRRPGEKGLNQTDAVRGIRRTCFRLSAHSCTLPVLPSNFFLLLLPLSVTCFSTSSVQRGELGLDLRRHAGGKRYHDCPSQPGTLFPP